MKKMYLLMPFVALALASCSNDDDALNSRSAALNVKVALDNPSSRALITNTTFAAGTEIGIFMTEEDGSAYDDQTTGYSNVKYTASGEGDDQIWTNTTNPIMLSATNGKAVAYYPWFDNDDMTAIPLETTSQNDYMYSNSQVVNNGKTDATFVMSHALTAVRVKIINDSYSGAGLVEGISIKSTNFATAGSMDITDGTVSYTVGTEGTVVALPVASDAKTEAAAPYTNEYMLVPTGTNGEIQVDVNMDGKLFRNKVTLTAAALKGYIYTIELSAKNNSLGITKVTIDPWKEGETVTGDMTIVPNT